MTYLSKGIRHSIFNSKDHYVAFRAKWSELVNSEKKHQLSVEYHLLYAILRGKDWRKGFSFPSEHKGDYKSRNPFMPGGTIHYAFYHLEFESLRKKMIELFDGLITDDMIDKALSYVKKPELIHPPIWELPYHDEPQMLKKWINVPWENRKNSNGEQMFRSTMITINPWATEELMEA